MLASFPPVPDAGASWALFLDVDGTLVDIAERPDKVIVDGGLPNILRRLRQFLGGATALVSGRSLASLDDLIGTAGLDAAGCHGAELRIRGREIVAVSTAENLGMLANQIIARVSGIPGMLVEPKPHSIALHYRDSTLSADEVHDIVSSAIGKGERGLRIIMGKKVAEILPAAAGKGVAIARFMTESPYRGRRAVFVGDDATDEEGFAVVNQLGGISVYVGVEETTSAHYRISASADVLSWLEGPVIGALERLAETVAK
jgi:trehalose 6-phosphate phosphatase